MPEYYELWLFDTFIEPQSPVLNDSHQARLAHSIIAVSPNLTKEARRKLDMKDFYLIKPKVFKSEQEIQEEREQKEKQARKNLEALMDPTLLEKARKLKRKG
ncbi:hypothetical protein EDF75_1344 [Raoultella sp. BIGb0149]|uniref:hypothetical protein n=1 Tax=Raoultella sp. BIGb0149 TaxID=2485116 RepID=UPI00105E4F22|nr:hypothetical protein [Raoultella sp. BIGb0149]TDQ27277.1 hypothetical protein EDF75_1344 [Raoultella sp. BIGb0149]